jgi:isomerase DpgB
MTRPEGTQTAAARTAANQTANIQDGSGADMAAEEIILTVDGANTPYAQAVAAVAAVCDRAEDAGGARVVIRASGTPDRSWADGLTTGLVSKWERALRRLETLPATTIAIAEGPCGGLALDVLLAADYRIATPEASLAVPVGADATWPGMALYRLAGHGAAAAPIRRAVLFGEAIGAAEALGLHLVDEVSADVDRALAEAVARTGAVSGKELAIRRQLMFDAGTASFEEALGAHLAACDRVLRRAAAGAAA